MVIDTSALLAAAEITTVPLGETHVHWALVGWRRFGKGPHRAVLNFGDCFSYGLAMALEAPLLFKGADTSPPPMFSRRWSRRRSIPAR